MTSSQPTIHIISERALAIPFREASLGTLARQQPQRQHQLFSALRDKFSPNTYAAGFYTHSDTAHDAELAAFLVQHSLDHLDISIPPLAPTPPPSPIPAEPVPEPEPVVVVLTQEPPPAIEAPVAVVEEPSVIEETPEREIEPAPAPIAPLVPEEPNDEPEPEVEDDVEMPDATPVATLDPTPLVATPSEPLIPLPPASSPLALPVTAPSCPVKPALESDAPPSLVAVALPPTIKTSPVAIDTTIPLPPLPKTIPDSQLAPSSSSSQLSPAWPAASTSQVPYTSASSLSPSLLTFAPSPAPSIEEAASPYHFSSALSFHIPAIHPDYAQQLPDLPLEVLKSRLAVSGRRKGKEKATSSAAPDLYKMHVTANHTGASVFIGRGKPIHNVLSTHDWNVGLEEVRARRAFERIEQLKQEKAWSFRQPKKQRTGLVPKAHWDHLLDEMRWLQTDFRQEHRWKIATAYNLAREVKRWHRSSPEDRKLLCTVACPPTLLPLPSDAPSTTATSSPMSGTFSGGAKNRRSRDQSTSSRKAEDMDIDADGEVDAEGEEREATVDVDADADADGEADADADGEADDATVVKMEPDTASKIPPAPAAPVVAGAGAVTDAQRAALAQQANSVRLQNLVTYRAPIFSLGTDVTVIDSRQLAATSAVDMDPAVAGSLVSLFPEIPLYTKEFNFDPQNEKRFEDSSSWGGKLSFVTHLLETKPLLVSTLEPARNRGRDGWDPSIASFLDESLSHDHREVPPTTSALFSHPPGKKFKEIEKTETPTAPPHITSPAARAVSLHWTPEEDALVVSLHKQYGAHWNLIAEVFNGSTNRPEPDYRLGWDLYDRWDKLAGPSSHKILADGTEIPVDPPAYQPPIDKATGKGPPFATFEGSRKRLRHLTVYDAMRKVQKKREMTAAKQSAAGIPRRINMSMHDSHNLAPRPVFTPMEWSNVKVEQDANKLRMRQQQDMQIQQQRLQQQALAQAQQAAQQGGQPPPNGVRYPQPVPQGFPLQQGRPVSGLPPQQNGRIMSPSGGTPSSLPNLPSPHGSGGGSPVPMPSPNGQQQFPVPAQGFPNGTGPGTMTPEQMALFQQHRQQLMYQQQQAQAMAMANAQRTAGEEA